MAVDGAHGRVVLVVRDQPQGWRIELTRFHRPTVVRCEVIDGCKRSLLIGAYAPPSTLEKLPDLEEDLKCF